MFYSVGENQKGQDGEYKLFTYYNEKKEVTGRLRCPLDKVEGSIERLNNRGMTPI